MDGIILRDQEVPEGYNSTARTYGGVTLNNEEHLVLSLPPKFAVYNKVREEPCEAEIEKMLAKLRWEEKRKEIDSDGNELPMEVRHWHNQQTKTMDMREFRSTYLPFNNRI